MCRAGVLPKREAPESTDKHQGGEITKRQRLGSAVVAPVNTVPAVDVRGNYKYDDKYEYCVIWLYLHLECKYWRCHG